MSFNRKSPGGQKSKGPSRRWSGVQTQRGQGSLGTRQNPDSKTSTPSSSVARVPRPFVKTTRSWSPVLVTVLHST